MRLFLIIAFLIPMISFSQNWEYLVNAGGIKGDKGSTIVVDDAGNQYITGYYNEEANFGPFNTGFSYTQSKETFVAKLDPQGNFIWVTNATNYYDDRGLGLAIDNQGNTYVTGTCWGGLVWGPLNVYNSTSYTDQIYVTKIDPNGNPVWMKNAGVDDGGYPYNDDHGQDIVCDSQGNIFVTGFLSNNQTVATTANFDNIQIPMSANDSLSFLAKLAPDGTWQWVETFEGTYGMYIPGVIDYGRDNGIGVDDDDNVYVVGGFRGPSTFGTTNLTSTLFPDTMTTNFHDYSSDIYVVKFDNNGNFQFVVQVADSMDARADAITYGNDGHMYVTGEFRTDVLFGTDDLNNYGSPGDKDCFVAKMTKDGQWVWATKAGSTKGGDRGIGICANNEGNIFVAGQYRGQARFGDINIDAGLNGTQLFVGMIDTLGIWQWVKEGGGVGEDRATSVACDDNCNVYAIGWFDGSMVLDSLAATSYGGKDIWIAKIADGCEGQFPPPPPGGGSDPNNDGVLDYYTGDATGGNVFSPNGDGVNDMFYFLNAESVEGSVAVINRWGNVVFESKNIIQPWNGNNQSGQPVVDGTYFYRLEWKVSEFESKKYQGFITIVR